jgi:hypothetical protein
MGIVVFHDARSFEGSLFAFLSGESRCVIASL